MWMPTLATVGASSELTPACRVRHAPTGRHVMTAVVAEAPPAGRRWRVGVEEVCVELGRNPGVFIASDSIHPASGQAHDWVQVVPVRTLPSRRAVAMHHRSGGSAATVSTA